MAKFERFPTAVVAVEVRDEVATQASWVRFQWHSGWQTAQSFFALASPDWKTNKQKILTVPLICNDRGKQWSLIFFCFRLPRSGELHLLHSATTPPITARNLICYVYKFLYYRILLVLVIYNCSEIIQQDRGWINGNCFQRETGFQESRKSSRDDVNSTSVDPRRNPRSLIKIQRCVIIPIRDSNESNGSIFHLPNPLTRSL